MLIANEKWAKFTFGPLLSHGGFRGASWWTAHLQQVGFQISEQGTYPLTFYLLARRNALSADFVKSRLSERAPDKDHYRNFLAAFTDRRLTRGE